MWIFALLACTDDTTGDADADDTGLAGGCFSRPASVEVGGGALAFEPVAEGAELTMVHGPQGGWHVLASARFTGVNPIVSIHYTIAAGSAEGPIVADNTYRVQIVQDVECGGYYPGMYGYLDVRALLDGERDTPPELLAGEPLFLTLATTDLEGRVATDTLTGVAGLDPMDEPE